MAVPVAAGQWRRDSFLEVWAVLNESETQPGRWVCTAGTFPYDVGVFGWRGLSAMELVGPDYYGKGNPHPGEHYWRAFQGATGSSGVLS